MLGRAWHPWSGLLIAAYFACLAGGKQGWCMRDRVVFGAAQGSSGHKLGPNTCIEVGVGAVELESGAHTAAGGRCCECASVVHLCSQDTCVCPTRRFI